MAAVLPLSDFDYTLPKECIASYPAAKRDEARLMVVHTKTGHVEHRLFKDVAEYFSDSSLFVLNDTKVLASRLFGRRRTGGKVELLLVKEKGPLVFDVLIKPARLTVGETIFFDGSPVTATLTARNEVVFQAQSRDAVYRLGVMPLPPYIKRKAEPEDSRNYQTVYAKHEGSVASPTAGLHFTDDLLAGLRARHIDCAYVTLHVGLATFKPVKTADIIRHEMGVEHFRISAEAHARIARAIERKQRICAVGTTSCRVLETYAARYVGQLPQSHAVVEADTDLFIYPGYQFKAVNALITNFHLPKTTLFILVCAFAGTQLMQDAYQEAIKENYRFYSYGDAMLIL